MTDVFVSIWCLETTYTSPSSWPGWCKKSLDGKLSTLRDVVADAHAAVKKANSGRPPALHLFASPEFTFASHETLAAMRRQKVQYTVADFAYDVPSMQRVASTIKTIGQESDFAGLLLAPGTVFWRTKRTDSESVVVNGTTYYFQPGEMEKKIGGTTYYRYSAGNPLEPKLAMPVTFGSPSSSTSSTNLALQQEVRENVEFALESTGKKLNSGQLTPDDLAAIRNTAYLASAAGCTQYDKMYPDSSEFGETFTIFTPGKKAFVSTFNGVKIGLEICADHANGVLRTASTNEVDLHLILSAYVSLDNDCVCAKNNGFVVLADSRAPGVYPYIGKDVKSALDPLLVFESQGSPVNIYKLTV